MARQFKRKYSLSLVGETDTKVITDLRVSFEITKSSRSYPNLAKIDIYNPNQETIALIDGGDPLIVFSAGYEGNIGLIFRGRKRNTFINKQSQDRIITIYAADGGKDWESAIYNKTASENLKLKDIVLELFTSFTESGDISIGSIEGIDIPADKLLGQTLSGSSKDILDVLAQDYGFQWSIQDGELILTKDDTPLTTLESVLISQSTGMIGSPTVTEIGADVNSLMNPDLLPNRLFTIESESNEIALSNLQFRKIKRTTAEGSYRAFEVTFIGDTHGNQWFSQVKGSSLT